MDSIERKVLKSICSNLAASTLVAWKEGDLTAWSNWAHRMRDTINGSVNIITTMIKEDEEKSNNFQL